MLGVVRKVVIFLFCLWSAVASAQPVEPLSEGEKLELEIYRKRTPRLQMQIKELEHQLSHATSCQEENSEKEPACRYRAKWYEFQGEAFDFNLSVFKWQIFAANFVIILISMMVVADIMFAEYQLWTSAKLAVLSGNSVELAVSTKQVRLQTSVVGVVLIVLAGLFLLLFIREVYKIELVDVSRTTGVANARLLSSGYP